MLSAVDERLLTLIRTAQTRLPWFPDVKAAGQRVVRQALRRPFETDFRAISLLGIPAGSLYLDVGANRGQSIDAIRLCASAPRVEAFEPNNRLAAKLSARFESDRGVTVRNMALGDQPGRFRLYVPSYRGYVFDGLASLDEQSAREWLPTRLRRFDERLMRVQAFDCEVMRLDDLELAPAFVKLDVQGFEHQALVGGQRTLEQHHPSLLVEAPIEETVTYLANFGYKPYAYLGGHLVPDARGDLNTFFTT